MKSHIPVSVGYAAHPEWNPWANDHPTLELYRRRCRREVEEMTCARQAAAILAEKIQPGETLLDAGCGGGYYYWSFLGRGIRMEYHAMDYTPEMIELARREICPKADLPESRFALGAIEHVEEVFDTVLCFNVLTNNPHYALPLERLLKVAKRRILIRESLADQLTVRYTPDPYLDEGKRHIRVYHNIYPLQEMVTFMEERGFRVTGIKDERTQDGVEQVVDLPHYWRILLGERVVPA